MRKDAHLTGLTAVTAGHVDPKFGAEALRLVEGRVGLAVQGDKVVTFEL